MKRLPIEGKYIVADGARILATHSVLQAIQVTDRVYVIYDYMEFKQKPSRNLFAYDLTGKELWRAQDIGWEAVDSYTGFITETPLTVFNFACFECVINEVNGHVVSTQFTK